MNADCFEEQARHITAGERRRSPRLHVLLSAEIESSGYSATAKVRNISGTGAWLQGEAPSEALVTFRKGAISVRGRVVRDCRDGFAIEFGRSIDPNVLLPESKRRSRRPNVDLRNEKRPGLACVPLTPSEVTHAERLGMRFCSSAEIST